jgi:hypothetical protein
MGKINDPYEKEIYRIAQLASAIPRTLALHANLCRKDYIVPKPKTKNAIP